MAGTIPILTKPFVTPRGNAVTMRVRDGTADWNNVYSCLNEDEYGLRNIDLGEGVGLDVGAHIGGVTIALAVDNPHAKVIAVEALAANVELLRANAVDNGVAERVEIIHGAAYRPTPEQAQVPIEWGMDSDESERHHQFIGNAHGLGRGNAKTEWVDAFSLDEIAALAGDIRFLKIDCELCEYDFLDTPAVAHVAEMAGEYHGGWDRLVALLDATHEVYRVGGGTESFGGFHAVRR